MSNSSVVTFYIFVNYAAVNLKINQPTHKHSLNFSVVYNTHTHTHASVPTFVQCEPGICPGWGQGPVFLKPYSEDLW